MGHKSNAGSNWKVKADQRSTLREQQTQPVRPNPNGNRAERRAAARRGKTST